MHEQKTLAIEGSEDLLVLYPHEDGPLRYANLVRVRPNGSRVWTAQPPEGHDAWVDASLEGEAVVAHSWSCWRVTLDQATGSELERIFTK